MRTLIGVPEPCPRVREGVARPEALGACREGRLLEDALAEAHAAACAYRAAARGLPDPLVASVNVAALLLSIATIVAVFRFKLGTLTVLVAAGAAGILLHTAGATA